MTMNHREVVHRVMLAAVKARSIAAENDTAGVASILSPRLHDVDEPLNIVLVCERVLEGNREVTALDAMNVLTLARGLPELEIMYSLRWDGEIMPSPMDAFA